MGPLKTIKEAAEWLKISPDLLGDWVTAGQVPFTTLNSRTADGKPSTRLVRFAEEHLAAIVEMGERWPESEQAAVPRTGPAQPDPVIPSPRRSRRGRIPERVG